jgi:hypothetical protein
VTTEGARGCFRATAVHRCVSRKHGANRFLTHEEVLPDRFQRGRSVAVSGRTLALDPLPFVAAIAMGAASFPTGAERTATGVERIARPKPVAVADRCAVSLMGPAEVDPVRPMQRRRHRQQSAAGIVCKRLPRNLQCRPGRLPVVAARSTQGAHTIHVLRGY